MAISALLQAQFEFTEELAQLVVWVQARGWRCKITECGVTKLRSGYQGYQGGIKIPFSDAIHIAASNHYRGLAADIQLFVDLNKDGDVDWIKDGYHHAWVELEGFWTALRPGNKTGRGFHDANHVSREWAGVI
jgi:hypothetical protein